MTENTIRGQAGSFIIRDVSYVDVVSGNLIEHQHIRIADGRIRQISDREIPQQPDDQIINGQGRYLIPGLWDMHTHGLKLSPQLHHPLFLRYGVTSARDMSGCLNQDDDYWACPADRVAWNTASSRGEQIAPRYVLQSSYQTNGGNEVPKDFPDFFRLNSESDAEELAAFYVSQGANFIKTYTELTPEQFANLSQAAKEAGLNLAGHKPLTTDLQTALSANMTSVEHGRLFMFECYKDIENFRNEENPIRSYNSNKIREILNHQDSDRCETLMTQMANSNTHWVPTLTTLQMSAKARDPEFRQDPRTRLIPWIVQTLIWNQDINGAATRGYDDAGQFVYEDYFRAASQQIAQAHAKGVKIMAGSDNIDTYVFTGSSLHDELHMLVEAGLSNAEALAVGTIVAAQFSGHAADLGTIEENKIADLILLSDNPLADISHTLQIVSVMQNGVYLDHDTLMKLEAFSENAASSIHVNLHYLYDLLASPLMRAQFAD